MKLAKLSLAIAAIALSFSAAAENYVFNSSDGLTTITVHESSVRVQTNKNGYQQMAVWVSVASNRKNTVLRMQAVATGCSETQGKFAFLDEKESIDVATLRPWFHDGESVADSIAYVGCAMAVAQGKFTEGQNRQSSNAPKSRPSKYAL